MCEAAQLLASSAVRLLQGRPPGKQFPFLIQKSTERGTAELYLECGNECGSTLLLGGAGFKFP
jgi:16S rRNA U1498 N3-methylase RsmE